jgi:hypothetical protein
MTQASSVSLPADTPVRRESRQNLINGCQIWRLVALVIGRHICICKRKRPSGEFPVNRDNHSSAPLIPEFHVTTSLADLCGTNLLDHGDGLLTGNNG